MDLTKHWAATLDDYAIDLAWIPGGARLAAASASGNLTLFNTADGAVVKSWEANPNGINCLAANGAGLASGGQDGAVRIWDGSNGEAIASLTLGAAWVDHLGWRPTGGSIAAAAGKKLSFVSAEGTLLKTVAEAPKTISAIAWHPSGGAVAAAAFGGVRLWDADDFVLQKELPYNNGIHSLAWSPDGEWLVTGNQDPSVHLWKPDSDLELHMSGYEGKVKHLAFDKTSRWLATSGGSAACVWDCSGPGPEGREPAMLPHDAPITALAYQKNFSLLATAAMDGTCMIWSPERPKPLRATIRLPNAVTKLTWSPDDQYLAIGSDKGIVYVLRCKS